ncbi:NUDIX domain-containing protein [Micromonospora sp. NPDC004551]|uniref:NUDIX hydrolase n=1 Tax=Micromonospora sp. NPDC004551 TaxID=3154284 RepID=UPI0033BB41B4
MVRPAQHGDAELEGCGADLANREKSPYEFQVIRDERISFRGRVFEISELDVREMGISKTFERVRRAPGVRAIVRNAAGDVLLTREWRHELGRVDLRLPGGKVFDTLDEYRLCKGTDESLQSAASAAARRELREEAGIEARSVQFLHRSVCGATVEWDLYYFLAHDWRDAVDGPAPEPGEDITVSWMTQQETIAACLDGAVSEERSALVLLRLLLPER